MFFYLVLFFIPTIAMSTKLVLRIVRPGFSFHIALEVILDMLTIIVLPLLYLASETNPTNECCSPSSLAPEHMGVFWTLYIGISLIMVLLKYYRFTLPPLLEFSGGAVILLGFIFNFVIGLQLNSNITEIGIGTVPIALWMIFLMQDRVKYASLDTQEEDDEDYLDTPKAKPSIQSSSSFLSFTLKSLLALPPVSFAFWLIQLLFGQKPDGFILLFTQTYYQTFSELTPLCENVDCGGHYLCSVAANGNPEIVKSNRIGYRHGHLIACNRQLLISNAFEQILEERVPSLHRLIRKKYDLVGDRIHKNYDIYKEPWVSHIVYFVMKPLEWFFLLILYCVDLKPENRIAVQYTRTAETLTK